VKKLLCAWIIGSVAILGFGCAKRKETNMFFGLGLDQSTDREVDLL